MILAEGVGLATHADASGDGPTRATPLISTKLHAPQVNGYGDRPRLGSRLDHALDDGTRLTLLSAPPGYGKSVAVAGWLKSRAVPCAWLSLDDADNDPVRFLRYIVGSLRTVRPGIGGVASVLIEGDAGPESAAFLIDAMASTDDPFVLVLDDYHVIRSGAVHALLRALIEQGPPFVHLVVITREDPPFPLPRLRAHGRLVELRADDLRFTADEAAAYLAQGPGLDLDDEHVRRLLERTEGWIAGLQLAAISLRDEPAALDAIDAFTGTQRFVLDYLAAEVLGAAGSRTADLPRSDRRSPSGSRLALGGELSGREDSAALLERAERMNLFLIPLDVERQWYRFHHLFADYLRTLLDPVEQVALRERAADYLEANGLLEEAIAQAVKAGSTERAIRLLERQARRTYESGELTTLLAWLDAMPRDRIAASPELVYLRAVACFFVGRVEDAARTCDDGEAACPRDASPGPLLTACALIAAFSNRPDATALGRDAVEAIEGDPFLRARALQALATAYLAAGELESAGETARSALDLEAGSRRSTLIVPATTALVSVLNLTGHRREAETLCRQCLADHRAEVAHMAGGTPYALYWLGMMRYEANDLGEAIDALERAWAAAGTFGFGRALLTLGRLLPRPRPAGHRLTRGGHRCGSHGAPRRPRGGARPASKTCWTRSRRGFASCRATCRQRRAGRTGSAASGKASRARRGWPACRGISPWRGSGSRRAGPRTPGRTSAPRARRRRSPNDTADLISVGVLDAVLAEAAGNRAAAQRALEAAIRLAAPEGYVRRVVDEVRAVAHLLPAVRRAAPSFVDEVMGALAAVDHAVDPAPKPQRRVPVAGRARPTPRGADRARAGGPPPHGARLQRRRDRRRARRIARDRQVARRPHPLEARGEEPDPGAAAGPGARAGLGSGRRADRGAGTPIRRGRRSDATGRPVPIPPGRTNHPCGPSFLRASRGLRPARIRA